MSRTRNTTTSMISRVGSSAPALLKFVIAVPLKVLEPVRVSSDSMSPTLHSSDQVLVDKFTRRAHHPHRRDIVAFHVSGSSVLLIKRVVAVAGDTVGLEDGRLVVNGTALDEKFVNYDLTDATYFGPVTVPSGTVFTMGDNRPNSIDSRTFGPVPTKNLLGRVTLTIWPPG